MTTCDLIKRINQSRDFPTMLVKQHAQPPFKVHIVGKNKAFVWDAKVGSLVGSLPRFPLQNQFYGLPLSLTPEEVTLLLSEGIIVLVNDEKSHQTPTKLQIEEYEKSQKENENHQLQDISYDFKQKEKRKIGFVSSITIKTVSTNSFEWYNDDNQKFNTLEIAKQSNIWNWPETESEKYKFKIFYDLWKKGYFITSGIKFGGDYLLYSGDPLRFHSQYIATIMDRNKIISSLDIITFGRLGKAVKKSYMLCSWDQNFDKGIYFCLEWAGF
ncbi:7313_t:CDS:2 [Diversispora eburnea]|uniref:tRNA-splicing endonuclease subunit Sen34 n=1 Tax=Diversispora eburnea TaxID=1213867 RepID=A0A9N9FEY2_9GLOM|nr:7313_t:CDS:2 [Diversispora eburnea]